MSEEAAESPKSVIEGNDYDPLSQILGPLRSTLWAWQLWQMNAIAKQRGWTQFARLQNSYSAIYREDERELGPYCRASRISWMSFSALAMGFRARPGEKASGYTSRAVVNAKKRTTTDELVSRC